MNDKGVCRTAPATLVLLLTATPDWGYATKTPHPGDTESLDA